jgi:tyrosine-specific transport protein
MAHFLLLCLTENIIARHSIFKFFGYINKMMKLLSGIFLIIGAVIGGGIIAIPIASAKFGFLTTTVLILASWVVMTITGLKVLALSLTCPKKYNSYHSIVGHYLGIHVQTITSFCFLTLLYFSLSSYISGCTSLLMTHLNIGSSSYSYVSLSILLVVILGGLITVSAKYVIRANIIIVTIKLTLLLTILFSPYAYHGVPSQDLVNFNHSAFMALTLIIINAFGYHFIIPSLVTFYGKKNAIFFKKMIIISTSTVCILYLAWLFTIYSIIPLSGRHGLVAIYQSNNQLLAFNESLAYYLQSTTQVSLLNYFQMISLFGSFLCVSLGTFDFLVDVFKASSRVRIGVTTFIPPLLLTLVSENMYLLAMSLSGYIAIYLEIFIPFWASYIFKQFPHKKLSKSNLA